MRLRTNILTYVQVEEAVEAEPGLSDLQRVMLRASAYDSYDMLVVTDEFVNQERANPSHLLFCLELLRVLAPGSESHTSVALKYDSVMRDRLLMAESLFKKSQSPSKRQQAATIMKTCAKEAELAGSYCLDAYITRYGWVNLDMYETLRQGTEVHTEALEQMSIMEAQGLSETSKDFSINGVNVSVVDKVDLGGANAFPSGLSSSQATSSSSDDNSASIQVMEAPSSSAKRGSAGKGGWEPEMVEAEVQDVSESSDADAT
ncbi:hypothetical protein DUNSADRAFT_14786 [Dunaliella salina]|uniref:Uncharacterized protein n=1 Tax=Dunaliella salina TaxID=3046 RepID=A0ABQ7G6S0_DUNSA|nr:hypothetical protein DUNSADRAFT_14786 [Dunaliella salina]|eukprot:KAF5830280.1 hypothetical protein DUNSADRAFT_14786 [Dunaliella salina]